MCVTSLGLRLAKLQSRLTKSTSSQLDMLSLQAQTVTQSSFPLIHLKCTNSSTSFNSCSVSQKLKFEVFCGSRHTLSCESYASNLAPDFGSLCNPERHCPAVQ